MPDPSTFINYHRHHFDYARALRHSPTLAEKIVWNALRQDNLGWRFLRQKPIGPYIADFYCSKLQLCIEVDGKYHEQTSTYDIEREQYMKKHGITTLRFPNTDIFTNLDQVIAEIMYWIIDWEE